MKRSEKIGLTIGALVVGMGLVWAIGIAVPDTYWEAEDLDGPWTLFATKHALGSVEMRGPRFWARVDNTICNCATLDEAKQYVTDRIGQKPDTDKEEEEA